MERLTKKEAVRLHREMWRIISEMTDEEIMKKGNLFPAEAELFALKKMGYTKDNNPYKLNFCCEYVFQISGSPNFHCYECPIKWKGDYCLNCGEFGKFCAEYLTGAYKKARETAKLISELPEREDSENTIKTSGSVSLNKDADMMLYEPCKTESNRGVVTIIGSLNQSSGPIQDAAKLFENLGFEVHDPLTNNKNKDDTLYSLQCRYLKYIEESDFVILVRKPDGSIGESTSYELAFSTYLGKPIVEWGTFFNG